MLVKRFFDRLTRLPKIVGKCEWDVNQTKRMARELIIRSFGERAEKDYRKILIYR